MLFSLPGSLVGQPVDGLYRFLVSMPRRLQAIGFLERGHGRLRSAEILRREDGSFRMIRRAETDRDYFATLDVDPAAKALGL